MENRTIGRVYIEHGHVLNLLSSGISSNEDDQEKKSSRKEDGSSRLSPKTSTSFGMAGGVVAFLSLSLVLNSDANLCSLFLVNLDGPFQLLRQDTNQVQAK